ncbi:MAG: hypothetical protein M1381_09055 [Deltaproteobacteria bacterium]|nr:hypothetical protein [Deltaproteobacteria bacterium]MCL5792897.1 hypothetical protein [Deltaproteobacteria bacterium]
MIKRPLIGIAGLLCFFFSIFLINHYNKKPLKTDEFQELAFFPSEPFIKAAVFHYDNFFSDISWMQSVQYIGKHLATDREFNLLYHIYDVVTKLDPRFIDAYNFGAIMLAQYNKDAPSAMNLLKLGMKRDPDSWEIPFQAGFIAFTIYKNNAIALHYFKIANKKTEHHKTIEQYIAFLSEKQGSVDIALKMWTDMYNSSNDTITKNICLYNILRLNVKKYEKLLTQAIDNYKHSEHRVPKSLESLVSKGYINKIPSVVSWKPFQYNTKTGKLIAPDITWKDVALYQNALHQ